MASAKSRKKYSRSRGTIEAEPSILIVTEGEKTEPIYFTALRGALHLAATQIVVVKADGTDPRSVVTSAVDLVRERKRAAKLGEGLEYGEAWVVFDSEQKIGTVELNGAIAMAEAAGIRVAMSAPCFEYWLVLHFEYTTRYMLSYAEVEPRLKNHIADYNKSRPPMDRLLPLVPDAVRNSARCVVEQDKVDALIPRTDVHRLVGRMNEATREHNRIM